LAVAIGYPDLVSIANTALNQTGRALECISILMAVYLILSLSVSWSMNQIKDKATLAQEKDLTQKRSPKNSTLKLASKEGGSAP
jgi:ABC-type arginine/histidine transport system permease subunit